jgi:hypothetical protein
VTGPLGVVAGAAKKDTELLYASVRLDGGGRTTADVLIMPVRYEFNGFIAG